ncbi:D-alanyl-D-alanine carboxypeptidase [Clostridium perfringens]|nr:D-alanyl-D-alanine carboxypeptidase [Clostridium perfringens]EHK2440451.1 D-alanyl-D-alanine carboxypeptidase [Clostridium perfringens]HAT4338178.1 D-alanyl-D-alanine carboxypeptidase [Clostridium perfringens]HAT4344497.1 D-alanyl-D-alanine carboxypeptidase [Clostridium perfringens]
MKKYIRKIAAFAIFLSLFSIVSSVPVKAEEAIEVEARSALLMEASTGKIIYEKNANEKFAPASVTKIMTMLLAMEKIDRGEMKLSDQITVSETAKKMGGSTMLLDVGEVRTVEEIIKGIGIASGNDAAVAMAEYLGGSESGFVEMMNKRAQELGMKNTTFKNCTGLPIEGHLSTAYDISIMSRELLKHPTILKYTGTYMETISEGRKSPIELVNHNKLVRFFKGCDGLKTGFTNDAKYCISATATRDGVRMLSVIMGAPTFKIRNRDASMLMNYGFSKFESKQVATKDGEVEQIPMSQTGDKFIIGKAKDDLILVCPKGMGDKIEKKVVLDESKKKIKEFDTVGYCEYYLDGELLGKVELYSDRDMRKGGIIDSVKFKVKNFFNGEEEDKVEEKTEEKSNEK